MSFNVEIDAHGPIFDGAINGIILRYQYHLEDVLGEKGVTWIRAYLPTQYKYLNDPASAAWNNKITHLIPGLYQSVIHTVATADAVLIHDTPSVYGPWLEGVSRRNQTTRFKGYHTFRIIAQRLNAVAQEVAYEELPPYIMEMNA